RRASTRDPRTDGWHWVERDRRRRGASVSEAESGIAAGRLAHDVSILFGVGCHFGSQLGAKVSMMIMRAPQHGHGQGSTRSVSGATSGFCWGSAAGGATLRSARALAMFSARLVDANSP